MDRQAPLTTAARCRAGLAQGAAIALGLLLPGATPALAQTVTVTAQAVIVEPLGLVKVQDLQFGRIAASASPGVIIVDANTGTCSATGGVRSAGGCGFARFSGQGARRLTVRIQLPTTITLTGPAGSTMSADMVLGASPDLALIGGGGNGNNGPRYQITSNSGIFSFRLGGRLNVAAGQRPGQYTGTFPVTVQYQ